LAGLSCALYGQSAEAVFQQAASALASQDYAAAERGFEKVLRIEPGNVPALGNLGVIYSKTQRYTLAIDTYKRALRIVSGDKALSTNLGLAYIKQEQYTAALPVFERLAADPANLQARELLATCQVSLGHYDSAIQTLQPLLSKEPGNPGVLYMLGIACTRLKRPAEAQAAFTKMMEAVSPSQANFLMGKASYETQHFPEAAAFFRKAVEADPAFEDAHRELGKTLISLREDADAEAELRKCPAGDAEALYFLGGLLAQSRPGEAMPILEKASRMTPDFWGPMYYMGRIDVEQGRVKEALPLLERAARLNPNESAIQYQLGRALQKAGRAAEAGAAFARVKELKERSLDKEVHAISPDSKP
jgi:protein O-GlcNAc transferase